MKSDDNERKPNDFYRVLEHFFDRNGGDVICSIRTLGVLCACSMCVYIIHFFSFFVLQERFFVLRLCRAYYVNSPRVNESQQHYDKAYSNDRGTH